MQKMLSYVRRAVDHYNMIKEGDRVAVGVSGGKDSLALLVALTQLSRFYPEKFEVVAITLEMGYDEMDFSPVQALCDRLGVEYIRVPTQIGPIIFDIRHEENPCALCAKMRRGALHEAAKAAGCNKVALGHHFDDVVETYMLSLFYEGRISCFQPVTYLARASKKSGKDHAGSAGADFRRDATLSAGRLGAGPDTEETAREKINSAFAKKLLSIRAQDDIIIKHL